MKRIWHFGDTHGKHEEIKVPANIDIAIFSGDCSNSFDPYRNSGEVISFIAWYATLPVKHKVFIPGNHDGSIERGLVEKAKLINEGIIYLENDWIEIDGIKIWGSPITPTFGNWYFMKPRHKLHELWQHIPDDTDIIITHGPPKGILDLSLSRENDLEQCGCTALAKRIEQVRPRFVCFGHIHNTKWIKNAGIYTDPNNGVTYSNGSCVTDGEFDKGPSSHGNILEYH